MTPRTKYRTILRSVAAIGAVTVAFVAAPAVTGADGVGDTVNVNPASAPVGSTITVSGTIDCPRDGDGKANVLITMVDHLAGPQTRARLGATDGNPVGDDGGFSVSDVVPAELQQLLIGEGITPVPVEAREYKIDAQCNIGDPDPKTIQTSFTVTATPTTTTTTTAPTTTTTTVPGYTPPAQLPTGAAPFENPPAGSVVAGGTVNVSETGFEPGETTHIVLYSTPVVLATVKADASGTVKASVTIPTGTQLGRHTLAVLGSDVVKATSLTVVAGGGSPSGTDEGARKITFTG